MKFEGYKLSAPGAVGDLGSAVAVEAARELVIVAVRADVTREADATGMAGTEKFTPDGPGRMSSAT